MELKCFNCNERITLDHPLSRRDECPKCHEDLRCCQNCEFYDPKTYNECRETQAERILEKAKANMCDFFQPRSGDVAQRTEAQNHLAAAEALFKNFKKS